MLIVSAMDLRKRDDSRFLINLTAHFRLCNTHRSQKGVLLLSDKERPIAPPGVTSRNCRRFAQKGRRSICLPPIG